MRKKILALAVISPLLMFCVEANESLVQTQVVKKAEVKSLQTFIGSVEFEQSAKVASEGSGAVVFVNFKEGDGVKAGQVLNRLDSQILDAQILSSQSTLDETLVNVQKAKKDFKRYEILIKQDAVSQSTYDDNFFNLQSLQNRVASLRANIKAQEIQKAKKVTLAPFSGIIVSKNIELGDWAGQGSVVAKLINPASAQVEVNLPQEIVSNLKPKMPVNIKIGEKNYKGFVDVIIPKGDISTRTFPVKISFSKTPKNLLEGMSAFIEIQSAKDITALLVPRDALIQKFGQRVVFYDAKGIAMMIPIKVVGYSNGSVAVTGNGLVEGMRVVTKGNERIFPNSPIKDITKVK